MREEREEAVYKRKMCEKKNRDLARKIQLKNNEVKMYKERVSQMHG